MRTRILILPRKENLYGFFRFLEYIWVHSDLKEKSPLQIDLSLLVFASAVNFLVSFDIFHSEIFIVSTLLFFVNEIPV